MEKILLSQSNQTPRTPQENKANDLQAQPKMNSNPQFLTIAEKRAWLARIFRDTSGYYTAADKFKALQEDTNLALISEKQQTKPTKRNKK